MPEITPETGGEYHVVRPYGWGLLTLWDSATTALPEGPADALVWEADDALSIPVRHAQDVDHTAGSDSDEDADADVDTDAEPDGELAPFEVDLSVRVLVRGASAPAADPDVELDGDSADETLTRHTLEPDYRGMISCPSGVLTVGDAEHTEDLRIGAGRWHVTVGVEPRDYPARVEVWLARGLNR